jgi:hypothetical protein
MSIKNRNIKVLALFIFGRVRGIPIPRIFHG